MISAKSFIYPTILLVLIAACTQQQPTPQDLKNPTQAQSKYPFLYSSDDALYMSWIGSNPENEMNALHYTRFDGSSWTAPFTITQDSSWFVNWADFPSIIAKQGEPMAVHWLHKIPGGPYAYNVNIAMADPSATSHWSNALIPHSDSTATEHGFVSMIPWDSNTVLAVWLDGRRTANRSQQEYYDIQKAMTLRGALINKSGNVERSFLIDESVCDCCQTSLAKTPKGAIVAYRNRTDDEIRDIYISRFDGKQWSDPTAVHNDNWEISACPVNGPAIAAERSVVAVSWYTSANDKPRTQTAVSTDFGTTFSKPIKLSGQSSLGRVDISVRDGQIYTSWMEAAPGDTEKALLKLGHFEATDTTSNNIEISTISSDRSTGFPQMELFNDKIIFAWTNPDSTGSKVITKSLQRPTEY